MHLNRIHLQLGLLILATSFALAQFSLKPAIQTSVSAPAISVSQRLVDTPPEYHQKSVTLAIAYSLILPGLGDLYADNFQVGRYFMGTDAGLWLTYGSLRIYGNWLKRDAQTFAVQHAGANFDGKGDRFAVDLGNFNNVFDYDDAKLRNRQDSLAYDPNSSFYWQWTSDQDRARYKNLRIRGDGVIHNSQFVIGALVLNRIVAAISAVRSVSIYNKNAQLFGSWRLRADVSGGLSDAQNVVLTLSRDF